VGIEAVSHGNRENRSSRFSGRTLTIGLAISVRYRLDPHRLGYIHANLAQPVDSEIVAPVVSTAFRDLAPQLRRARSLRLEARRVRTKSAKTSRSPGLRRIVVKEVLLRDVHLPRYAKGLEGLLLKEQGKRSAWNLKRDQREASAHRRTPCGSRQGAAI